MLLDFGASKYRLTAETEAGLAAEIAVVAADNQFLKDERIAIKIEVEVEIDLGNGSSSESDEEEGETETVQKDRPITETELAQQEIPLETDEASEPMVLDPATLVEAPTPDAPEFSKPMLPPVPFPWNDK